MSASDDQIVEGLDMVRRMAARYRGTPLGAEDAFGVGSLALVEAAQRFDPGHGAPFLGYAFLRVRGSMADACRSGTRGARNDREVVCDPDEFCEVGDLRELRPEARLDVLTAVGRLRRRLRVVLLHHACGVPHRQIAADMGVTESRVSQLLTLARRRVRAEAGVNLE
jgi:RNA polymerase sigma factor (sigma-70 family)